MAIWSLMAQNRFDLIDLHENSSTSRPPAVSEIDSSLAGVGLDSEHDDGVPVAAERRSRPSGGHPDSQPHDQDREGRRFVKIQVVS